jgi:hypothetical protein
MARTFRAACRPFVAPGVRGLAGIRARASLIEAEAGWKRREDDGGTGGTVFTLKKRDASRV